MNWYVSHKRAVWIGIAVFAAIYLIVHFFIFDSDFHYTGVWNFIREGRGHLLHVAPPLAIFACFFAYEGITRFKKRWKK